MPITNVVAFWAGAPQAGTVISTGHIYAPHAGGNTQYPRTVGGITLGTLDASDLSILDTPSPAGWQTGDDPILRGRWRVNNAGFRDFRIDTGNGTFDVSVLLSAETFQSTRLRLFDGPTTGTLLFDISNRNPGDAPPTWPSAGWQDQFYDFATLRNGTAPDATVWRPIDADALSPAPFARQVVVTQGYVTLRIGEFSGGTNQSELSAFGWGLAATPAFNQIRFQGGANAPWHPAAGPTVGVPYTLTLEAWDSVLGVRDTAAAGNVTLGIDFVAGENVIIQSGPTSVPWSVGLATFTNVVFAEAPAVDPRIPGGGPRPEPRAGLARFLANNPKAAKLLRSKNPKGR